MKQAFEDISAKVKQQIEEYQGEKSKQMRVALRELARENIEFGEQVRTAVHLNRTLCSLRLHLSRTCTHCFTEYSIVERLRKVLRREVGTLCRLKVTVQIKHN